MPFLPSVSVTQTLIQTYIRVDIPIGAKLPGAQEYFDVPDIWDNGIDAMVPISVFVNAITHLEWLPATHYLSMVLSVDVWPDAFAKLKARGQLVGQQTK